uniref:Uncharacterized protein n=1 Tax=Setaria digitata TaxID=48799 RepID=A0A915PRA0_9BILA
MFWYQDLELCHMPIKFSVVAQARNLVWATDRCQSTRVGLGRGQSTVPLRTTTTPTQIVLTVQLHRNSIPGTQGMMNTGIWSPCVLAHTKFVDITTADKLWYMHNAENLICS